MSTYRKFDKWRQRADFLSDLEFGIDSVANKWIAAGTGTPAFTAAGQNGMSLGTSAAANDTAFIQRGVVSAATRAAPIQFIQGLKMHMVATFLLPTFPATGGFSIGFGVAAASTPLGQNRIALQYDNEDGFTAVVGLNASPLTANLDAPLSEFTQPAAQDAAGPSIDLEVYYDGTDHVQFYAGGKRILKVGDIPFDANGFGAGLTAGLSPTVGVYNDGTAVAHSVFIPLLGYAMQRRPART